MEILIITVIALVGILVVTLLPLLLDHSYRKLRVDPENKDNIQIKETYFSKWKYYCKSEDLVR